jgi:hypothetical protein
MNVEDIITLACSVSTAILVSYLFRLKKVPRIYLTDYMQGLRFVKGLFAGLLGPGGHQPLTRGEHIEVVDMRPVPFVLESIWYRDALQSDSVVSVGAEMLVDDPYLAATSLKDRLGDTLPIVRDTLRSTISRTIVDRSPEARAKLGEDIQTGVNGELRQLGMKISNVEVTEIFSRGTAPRHIGKGLN